MISKGSKYNNEIASLSLQNVYFASFVAKSVAIGLNQQVEQ